MLGSDSPVPQHVPRGSYRAGGDRPRQLYGGQRLGMWRNGATLGWIVDYRLAQECSKGGCDLTDGGPAMGVEGATSEGRRWSNGRVPKSVTGVVCMTRVPVGAVHGRHGIPVHRYAVYRDDDRPWA